MQGRLDHRTSLPATAELMAPNGGRLRYAEGIRLVPSLRFAQMSRASPATQALIGLQNAYDAHTYASGVGRAVRVLVAPGAKMSSTSI